MVKLLAFSLPFLLVTFCCCTEYGKRQQNTSVSDSSPKRSPSTSRLYFHAYSLTKSGDKQDQHDSDNRNNNNITPIQHASSGVPKFPESIQAVNKSLGDDTLKLSETTRHLLGYEPETWNNRYTPPIPLDVLASETDEHDEATDDDDNDNDESNDDEQTQESNNNDDEGEAGANEEGHDDEEGHAPEQDGEATAQKVIDEIDGDISGQEGAGRNGDEFSFAATEQKPTVLTPNGEVSDKQKRCQTIYREINGFTPSSKLLSDDDDFDLHWRRKRSVPDNKAKNGPIGTGQAKSSSYMITRECTFDDDDDDQSEDELSENSDHDHDSKPAARKEQVKNSESSLGNGEKPKSTLSSIWSIRFPKSVPSTLSSSSPPSSSSSSSFSSSSLPFSPSSLTSSSSSSTRRTPGTRSESRFVPIFGWKKHPFIIHEEPTPSYYSEEPSAGLSMSNDFRPKSNRIRVAMNNDLGSDTDYWLQPGVQWNGWNHFSDSSDGELSSRPDSNYPKSHSNANSDTEDDHGNRYFKWRPMHTKSNKYPRKTMQKSSHANMEKSMKNMNERHQQKQRFTHSDDGDGDEGDGEGQQEDEHSDNSGEEEGSNDEEDSGMDRSPADSHDDGGSIRRMFIQHIRKRRSVDSFSTTLNNANFAWTQPAKAAKIQLANDTPYTWNYFEQKHPDNNNHDENSETFERKPISEDTKDDDEGDEEAQENDDESNDNHSDSDGTGSNDSDADGSESGTGGSGSGEGAGDGHDPENYSISYDGGNDEEYNVDYDSDRASDRGNGFNGGNTVSSADDDDEYEKF